MCACLSHYFSELWLFVIACFTNFCCGVGADIERKEKIDTRLPSLIRLPRRPPPPPPPPSSSSILPVYYSQQLPPPLPPSPPPSPPPPRLPPRIYDPSLPSYCLLTEQPLIPSLASTSTQDQQLYHRQPHSFSPPPPAPAPTFTPSPVPTPQRLKFTSHRLGNEQYHFP